LLIKIFKNPWEGGGKKNLGVWVEKPVGGEKKLGKFIFFFSPNWVPLEKKSPFLFPFPPQKKIRKKKKTRN